jgi:hypothetical protein
MTGHTTARNVPYALPTDALLDWPTTSLELANLIAGNLFSGCGVVADASIASLGAGGADTLIGFVTTRPGTSRGGSDAPVVGSSQILIKRAGLYACTLNMYFGAQSGTRRCQIKRLSDAAVIAFLAVPTNTAVGVAPALSCSGVHYFAANDSVVGYVWSDIAAGTVTAWMSAHLVAV